MKAEHRHELKTNELAQWLSDLPNWVQRNLRTIIYVAVVAVVVIAYAIWYEYQTRVVVSREQANMTAQLTQLPQLEAYIAQSQTQGTDNSYMLMQSVSGFEQIAAGAKNNSVAALAMIKQGDILRTELLFRPGVVSRQDLQSQIDRAKGCYTKALETYLSKSPNRSLEALAELGLGLCEEDLGNYEQARQIYEKITTNGAFEGTTAVAAARQRQDLMGSLNKRIVLMPSPAPVTPAPAQTPEIELVPEITGPPAPESRMPSPAPAPQIEAVGEANAAGLQ